MIENFSVYFARREFQMWIESNFPNERRQWRVAFLRGLLCEAACCGILTLTIASLAAYALQKSSKPKPEHGSADVQARVNAVNPPGASQPISSDAPATQPGASPVPLPTVVVTLAHVAIDHSCRVVIPPGTVLDDTDGTGAIRVTASNIEVEFAPESVLRGSPPERQPDEYKGYGLRLDGATT